MQSTSNLVHNIAVLGTGSIGMRHLRVLREFPLVHAWAIRIRREQIMELHAEGFSTCENLPAAKAHGVTAVIIATDTHRHAEDTLNALRLGLHVLVEKPVAVDASQMVNVRTTAASEGRKVHVACVLRFSQSLQLFREWLTRAGRLHSIRIECQSYLPDWRPDRPYRDSYSARANEGGVLRDLIHEIDYATWLFGWPLALQARLRNLNRLEIEAEEVAELSWITPAGALLSMSLDYLSRPPRRLMHAMGEYGTLEWDGIAQKVSWLPADEVSGEQRTFAQSRDEMLLAQARVFIESSNSITTPSSLATLDDGINAIVICDTARGASISCCEKIVPYV